jgi:hypothetical protein
MGDRKKVVCQYDEQQIIPISTIRFVKALHLE